MTSLLTEGLVARGHDVTLFATADSTTKAKLHAIYPHGYWHDENMWPWELYEMLNLAAAVERAAEFDIIHYEAAYYPMSLAFARLSPTPIVQTLHHAPSDGGGRTLVALSRSAVRRDLERAGPPPGGPQRRRHRAARHRHGQLHVPETPDDYLLFLGRFTEGKGVLQAIEIARRVGMRLVLAAAEDQYYRDTIAPHVDGTRIVYHGEADYAAKVKLYGGARALLYPIQAREPFGLVLAEAMACGTPVAALDRGAVREVVDDDVTGFVFSDLEQMVNELPRVFGLDRRRVRERAVARFGVQRMVDEYIAVYRRIVEAHRGSLADETGDLTGRTVLAVFAHPDDESLACGGTLARLADAGARVVLLCASRGENGSVSDPALVPDGDLGRVRVERAARGGKGPRHRRSHRARSPGRRPPLGPDSLSQRADCLGHQALPPRCGDHVRRRRPLLAPRSHRRPRAHLHGGWDRSAPAPPLYYVTMPHGVDARGGRGGDCQGLGAVPTRASGASRPTPSATRAERRR